MNLKYKTILTILGCLLVFSLLIGFSYAYIGKTNLANYNLNSVTVLIDQPYDLSFSPENKTIAANINVDSSDFNTIPYNDIVASNSGNMTISLLAASHRHGNQKIDIYNVTCDYYIYYKAISDYTMSAQDEFKIYLTSNGVGTDGYNNTKFGGYYSIDTMKASDEKVLYHGVLSSNGTRVYDNWNIEFQLFNVNADQSALMKNGISGYVGFRKGYCEVEE